jgi:protein-L-isoaspartate(D-aspartate) O-methyltransferase
MTLQNFEKARENMILSQLQSSGVVSERVTSAYQAIPREMFVPNALRGVSYLDDDIPVGQGRVLMEPLLHALMVQDADIQTDSKILDIGVATGYSSAVLAQLSGYITALERDERLLQEASSHWAELSLGDKITALVGDHAGGYAKSAPYNFIFINGATAEIPQALLDLLADGGRLYAVLMPAADIMGQVVVVTKEVQSEGKVIFATRVLGEGMTSYLPGLEPKQTFKF